MGESLSPSHPSDLAGKPTRRSFPPRARARRSRVSSSEEGECHSAEAPPPQSPRYEELLEVMTRAVAK